MGEYNEEPSTELGERDRNMHNMEELRLNVTDIHIWDGAG